MIAMCYYLFIFFIYYVNPEVGHFFPLTLHTGVHTQTHTCSEEEMSEGAATQATAPNEQC